MQVAKAPPQHPVPNGAAPAQQRLPDSDDEPRMPTANGKADSRGLPAWQDTVPGATQQRLAAELKGNVGSSTCSLSASAISGLLAAESMRPAALDKVLLRSAWSYNMSVHSCT